MQYWERRIIAVLGEEDNSSTGRGEDILAVLGEEDILAVLREEDILAVLREGTIHAGLGEEPLEASNATALLQ